MVPKMQKAAILAMLIFVESSFAQDPPTEAPNASRQSVLDDLLQKEKTLIEGYRKRQTEIQALYSEALQGFREEAIRKLKMLQAEVAAADLDEAVKLRDEATSLSKKSSDPPGTSAPSVNEGSRIRELRSTIAELESQVRALKDPISPLVGEWSGKFENGFQLQIVVRNDGFCVLSTRPQTNSSAKLPLLVKDGRVFVMRSGHNLVQEHLELLRSGGRLIALGWTMTRKAKNPMLDHPNITATFERVGELRDEPKSR